MDDTLSIGSDAEVIWLDDPFLRQTLTRPRSCSSRSRLPRKRQGSISRRTSATDQTIRSTRVRMPISRAEEATSSTSKEVSAVARREATLEAQPEGWEWEI